MWSLIFEVILSFNPVSGTEMAQDRYLGLPVFRSFFYHPGPYSAVMIVLSNYFFSLYLYVRKRLNLILLICSVIGLLSSTRVKVIILLPISCTLIWLLFISNEHRGSLKQLPVRKIFIIGTGIFFLCGGIYVSKTKLSHYSSSENVRLAIFLTSFKVSKEHNWFGAGFGRYGSAVSTRFYSPEYYKYGLNTLYGASPKKSNFITDQWWAWYIGESGVLGMVCFMAGIILLGRELILIAKKNHSSNKELSIIAFAALGGLIYGVGSGFAAGGLSGPPAAYYIMGLTGLALNFDFSRRTTINLYSHPT